MFRFRSEKKCSSQSDCAASTPRGLFRVPEGVQPAIDDQGLVLFSLTTGKLFRANRTGARIWSWITEGKEENLLALELSGEFGISVSRAAEDISRFLQSLLRSELLTIVEAVQ